MVKDFDKEDEDSKYTYKPIYTLSFLLIMK